jgi:16S rRNA (guanine1516-N2)-methyltransferase
MQQLTIITTAGRPDETSKGLAQYASSLLHYEIVERKKRSVAKLQQTYNANIIVAGKERYEYFAYGQQEPFFYHPNSAAFRIKRLAKGESETLIEASQLKAGDSFLDCTLGIGSDSLVAAFVVGKQGKVVGVEANQNVAFIVQEGMKTYNYEELPLTACMRDINVVHANAVRFLKDQPSNSFDVVYIDPMFEQVIEESKNFEALRAAGNHDALTDEWVSEAKRVAKRCVLLKAHFESPYFQRFGFHQYVRPTAKFHYGVIEV